MDASRTLATAMDALGQAARRSTLMGCGVTRMEIDAALASGFLQRPKRGWYVTKAADSDQHRAIMVGARLGCVSALRRWSVWSGPVNDLHLHCAPTASRLQLEQAITVRGNQPALPHPSLPSERIVELGNIWISSAGAPTVHWRRQASSMGALDWVVSPTDALAQAIRCQDEEHAVACIDSALRHRVVSAEEWRRLLKDLPDHLQPLSLKVDARADSGNETIVRLRLLAAGMQVEPQARIPGVGAVDMVVDDLVALEVDSEGFHSSKEQRRKDRTRTLLALAFGMPSLRIGSEHLAPDEWPLALTAVRRQVSDARTLHQLRAGKQLAR